METQLTLKTILVVGASSGIGSETSRQLLSFKDINLILVARDDDKLKKKFGGISNICIRKCDLTNSEDIEGLKKYLLNNNIKLDGMIYCAGVSPLMKVVETDLQVLHNTFQINVIAFIEIMKWFMTEEISNINARVVVMSSVAANISSYRQTVYASTKAALEEAVRCMAKEGVERRIRINALSAGAVNTPMLESLMEESKTLKEKLNSIYPYGVIPVDVIAKNIIYLLSDYSINTSGSILNIDSGFLIWK